MAWSLYAFTRGGLNLYEGSYHNQVQAENAADKAVQDGYLSIPDSNSGPDWIFPFACSEVLVLKVVEETDPGPNAVATDYIVGLDVL